MNNSISADATRRQSRRSFLQAAGAGIVAGTAMTGHASRAAETNAVRSATEGASAQRIDIHHHILPDFYVQALKSIGVNDVTGVPFPVWTPESTLGALPKLGVSKAIVSVSAPGVYFGDAGFARDLARRCNEFQAQFARQNPERIGGFASIPLPDVKDAIAETAHALDVLKLDGVCLLTNYDGIYLGDPRLDEYLAYLNQRRAVVLMHPTMAPASKLPDMQLSASILEFVFDTTRAITNLVVTGSLERYPDVRFIVSHLGGTIPMVAWRFSSNASLSLVPTPSVPVTSTGSR